MMDERSCVDFLLSLPSFTSVTDFRLSLLSAVTDFRLSASFGSCLITRFSLTGLFLKITTPQKPHRITNPKITESPIAAAWPF